MNSVAIFIVLLNLLLALTGCYNQEDNLSLKEGQDNKAEVPAGEIINPLGPAPILGAGPHALPPMAPDLAGVLAPPVSPAPVPPGLISSLIGIPSFTPSRGGSDKDDECTIDIPSEKCDACPLDTDRDGIPDGCDNCPFVPNKNQKDKDRDERGNACDNCINVPNFDQIDRDQDGIGAACDCDDNNAELGAINGTARYVSPTGNDVGNCTNVNEPCRTITYAVLISLPGDSIVIKDGQYNESNINIIHNLFLLGRGPDRSVVDGQNLNRVFVVPAAVEATLCGLTVQDGQVVDQGGGLQNNGVTTVSNVVFINNNALDGAGIANLNEITVINSILRSNVATGAGGGFFNGSAASATLINTIIENNTANAGGGLYNLNEVEINRSIVRANSAVFGGGGLFNEDDGFMRVNNSTIASNTTPADGAGLFNDGEFHIVDSTFDQNTALNQGGAIFSSSVADLSTITGSTIQNNRAANGGGIYANGPININTSIFLTNSNTLDLGGAILNNSNMEINATRFERNTSVGGGGAIASLENSNTIVNNSIFDANTATNVGGAFYNQGYAEFNLSVVKSNIANFGAGLFNEDQGLMRISTTTVELNSAANTGGGLFSDGSLQITQSTFNNNNSNDVAGGIYISPNVVSALIINSTISANRATNSGGGIRTDAPAASLLIRLTTITNNIAPTGAGIFGVATFYTSIVALQAGGGQDCSAVQVSQDYNIESGISCGFTQANDQQNVTAAQLNLGPLADNGGPTKTHELRFNSVAIDAGDTSCGVNVCQRGLPRPVDIPTANPIDAQARCDVGSFELQL